MDSETRARQPSSPQCVADWQKRFLEDLAVVRSANTVRAYAADLKRWISFCEQLGIHPFLVRPRAAVAFIRAERRRRSSASRTVGPRTIVRRLSAVRQWYAYLALEPDLTGVRHNPIPGGTGLRAAVGAATRSAALLRYDQPLPQTLSAEEMDRFLGCLTATRYRDRAIVWLLKDGGMRIGELLALRLGDINWSKRTLVLRVTKNQTERLVPITRDALTVLADYVRLERPKTLSHDSVFVNLGRRGFGEPFTYRSWAAVCERARAAAQAPRVHAHAFRHTYATNLAESGLPLDTLKRVLGHRHLDTLTIYNQVRDSRLHREYEAAMARQEAVRGARPSEPEGKER